MLLEWDETKRLSNLEKHGLDFQDTPLVFDGRPALHLSAKHNEEPRSLSIAIYWGEVFHRSMDLAGVPQADHIISESEA